MNFFQRRKILKSVNYLDLVPVRTMEYRPAEEGKIDILLPRFKNNFWREAYRKSRKGEYIYIHLDPQGSAIWLAIDGRKNVNALCTEVNILHPGLFQPADETAARVTQFLSLLYQQRYITFREITDNKNK
jgi:hypothetical protein